MNHHSIAIRFALSLSLAAAFPAAGQEAAKKAPEKQEKGEKKAAEAAVRLHVKVSRGSEQIPRDSHLELLAEDASCAKRYDEQGIVSTEGRADFSGVPVCKVRLRIFITGLDMQRVELDMASHKSTTSENPVQIEVSAAGGAKVLN